MMKIKTLYILGVCFFGLILIGVVVSLTLTNLQVVRLNQQEELANRIEREAVDLSYLSGDYLMYGESQQRARWEARFTDLAQDVSRLSASDASEKALIGGLQDNQRRLREVFTEVSATLSAPPQPTGAGLVPAYLRTSWSRMAVQSQAIVFSAS